MTKPLKHLYKIQYDDLTHQFVEWTKAEYDEVGDAIVNERAAITMKDGIFKLRYIRAIVYIPPVPEVKEETKPILREEKAKEWDFTGDPQIFEDLKALGLLELGEDEQ